VGLGEIFKGILVILRAGSDIQSRIEEAFLLIS